MIDTGTRWQVVFTALALTIAATSDGWYSNQENARCENVCEAQSTQEACNPCSEDCCGEFFLGGEVLYLRAFEGGLSSVCDGVEIINTTVDGITTSTLEGRGHEPNFNWNTGYRVGAGYGFAGNGCDVGAYWTHFSSHNGSGHNENRHHWDLDFDTIDAFFECEYEWPNCFSLTPYAGLRYARIDQKLRFNFTNTTDGIVTSTSTGRVKEDFKGLGPVFGLEGAVGLGCGFSLYGNVSIGVLYGTYHVRSSQNDAIGAVLNINNLNEHTQASQQVLDLGFGVRWNTCFCGNPVIMQLGLEQHRYFNHNQICEYGDLNLDGGSFALGFEF